MSAAGSKRFQAMKHLEERQPQVIEAYKEDGAESLRYSLIELNKARRDFAEDEYSDAEHKADREAIEVLIADESARARLASVSAGQDPSSLASIQGDHAAKEEPAPEIKSCRFHGIEYQYEHLDLKLESWGNRSFSRVIVPEGESLEGFMKKLNGVRNRSYPEFYIKDGELIEENYDSIGD